MVLPAGQPGEEQGANERGEEPTRDGGGQILGFPVFGEQGSGSSLIEGTGNWAVPGQGLLCPTALTPDASQHRKLCIAVIFVASTHCQEGAV